MSFQGSAARRLSEEKRRSLFSHLLSWIIPVTAGAILVSAATAYLAARGQILREAQEEVERRSRASAGELESFFRQRANDLTTVSRSPLFKDYFSNREYGLQHEAEVYRVEIERFLLDFSKRVEVYAQIVFIDEEGKDVVRIRERAPSVLRAGEFKGLAARLRDLRPDGRRLERLESVPWHGGPILRYGAPLYDAAGRLRGGLVFDCGMSHAYDLLRRQRADSAIRSHLTDREGGAEGKNYALVSEGSRLAASAVVQGTPWSVVSSVEQNELLDGLEIIGTATFLLCLATCLIMVFVVVHLVRGANRPLEELAEAVRSYAQGELDVRVRVPAQKEAATLAEAFNDMADRLKARTLDLVQRVRELTSLKRMSDAVVRQLGRREIGRACLESAVTGLMFERGVLYWVDYDRRLISGECVFGSEGTGYDETFVHAHSVSFDSNDVLAQVLRERRSINIPDVSADPRCDPKIVALSRTRAFCAAPILGRDRVLGIIGVDNPSSGKPVPPAQQRSLDLFCGAAGLALENAKLLDEIVRSEDRFQTAVENSPDGVVSLGEDLRIESWNRRAEAIFGYRRSEMKGETLAKVIDAADYARMGESPGAPIVCYEVAGLTRDGRRLELVVTWSSQGCEEGRSRGWLVVLRDVTEQRRLERSLIEVEKSAAAGRLIASVAHELKNPLGGVIGFAEVLMRSLRVHPEDREDFQRVHASAMRCKAVVNNLLTFVGKGESERVRVRVNEVVDATLALLEPRLVRTEKIELDVRLDPANPEIAGEFSKIQQVLVNLLVNAADALGEKKDGRRRIAVRTGLAGGRVGLEIVDNGPGVPRGMIRSIFEPFVTSKPVGKGTGLGLSISRQIVTEHGGSLEYSPGSESGEGARFTARFPPCPEGVQEAPKRSQLPPPVPGKRVLLVDDDPDQVRLMSRLLNEDGLFLRETASCDDAQAQLETGEFDLVVTDFKLGSKSGLDLYRRCRQAGNGVRFLFVSGDVLNKDLSRELSAGKLSFLNKPFLRSDFLTAVRGELAHATRCGKKQD